MVMENTEALQTIRSDMRSKGMDSSRNAEMYSYFIHQTKQFLI